MLLLCVGCVSCRCCSSLFVVVVVLCCWFLLVLLSLSLFGGCEYVSGLRGCCCLLLCSQCWCLLLFVVAVVRCVPCVVRCVLLWFVGVVVEM